jgi:hypothetical protein
VDTCEARRLTDTAGGHVPVRCGKPAGHVGAGDRTHEGRLQIFPVRWLDGAPAPAAQCVASKATTTAVGWIPIRCGKAARHVAAGDVDHEGWDVHLVGSLRWPDATAAAAAARSADGDTGDERGDGDEHRH